MNSTYRIRNILGSIRSNYSKDTRIRSRKKHQFSGLGRRLAPDPVGRSQERLDRLDRQDPERFCGLVRQRGNFVRWQIQPVR